MPKIRRPIGTGMTKRGTVTFDWDNPADVEVQVEAAIDAFEQSSFERLSRRIMDHARAILAAAGLPTDVNGVYALAEDRSWTQVEKIPRSRARKQRPLSLPQLVVLRGHASDSPEGYAVSLLFLINRANRLAAAGAIDEAMATAFTAGQQINEAAMKEIWEADALRGEKVLESARRGHAEVHGSEEAKTRRRAAYVRAFEAERKKGQSKMEAYEAVARQFDVDPRTIQRAVARARQ